MNPLISIIVPVYKAETTLRRCIDSLLNQSYKNIEIVIVDDGSPDKCPVVCDEYAACDGRVSVFHISNGGVSNARNVGIGYSKGDYLCFVDSDDYVDSSYIQNFMDGLLDKTDLVFQGINEVRDNDEIVRKVPSDALYDYEEILNGISDINKHSMFGYVCNKLYRRDIIVGHHLAFRTDISISEDRIFALQYMAYVKEMRTISKSAYYYVLQSTGLTLRKRSYDEIKKAADENLRVALDLLEKRNSERFLCDTRRMYVMAATGYLLALFEGEISFLSRKQAIHSFQDNYYGWLPYYKPVSTNQKVLYKCLRCTSVACVLLMQVYFFMKNLKHGRIAKSCF